MREPLAKKVVDIKPSGIRKFFDIVSEMKDAISLGVGEPDFDTPWHIRDEGIYALEKGRTLNRQLYYDLLSIYLLDPSLYKDDQSFATSMIYASTVSNQFHDMAVELKAVRIPNDNRNLYAYKISAYGNDDVWVSDAANKKFYFNNGKTEYNSTMYDEATFGLWYMAVKEYFGITVD